MFQDEIKSSNQRNEKLTIVKRHCKTSTDTNHTA